MTYRIAIPSHRRASLLGETTLALCEGIPKEQIFIFLSDQEDYEAYAPLYSEYNLIVTGAKDVVEKFNSIQQHWSGGDFVVVIEDDIKRLNSLKTDNLPKLLRFCTTWCAKQRIEAWGIYPSNNKYFMSETIDVGFSYLVANLFGFKPRQDARLLCKLPSKNDYERSMLYHKVYGKMARFNFVGCVTNNYTNKGGMQEQDNRAGKERVASRHLAKHHPEYFALNPNRKSMYEELKVKRNAKKIKL